MKTRRGKETRKERMKQQSANARIQGTKMPKYLFIDTESVCPKCNKAIMFTNTTDLMLTGRSTAVECKNCNSKIITSV